MKVKDNIVKECYEEAAIPTDVASRAISVGSIRYVNATKLIIRPTIVALLCMYTCAAISLKTREDYFLRRNFCLTWS